MTEKVSIPVSDNPTRSQSSLTAGNIRYRDLSGVTDASYIVIGVVTKVFYKKGTLDYSLSGTSDYTSLENISGSGSAPIPIDFWGYNSNNKPFGHYRSVKIGDKVALAFIEGKLAKPIVIGVYPSDTASYELISPVGYESGDDSTQSEEDMVLGDKKVYSNQQVFYRSGSGDILRTLNGNSFMQISDNTQDYMSDIWHTYDTLADVYLSDGTEVEPETETAQAWLLVHEDNPTADDGDSHLTRFYVNKKGEFQLVFMDTSDENTPVSILEGSKDSGFTLTKRFDNNNLDSDSTDYVTLNLGDSDSQSFKVEASNEVDSKTQSASLEVKSSGVYIDGENLEDYISNSTSITGADLDNALPDSTYFTNLQEKADKAGADAEAAAEAAQTAGEDAKTAGVAAEQAGEDAKAQATEIKNRIIYYTSISPEKDVYVPGKYLIINTDTYIADDTIKNAYIEDAAIDKAKIASEAVGASQIEDLAVTRAKIANLAVGSAQIEDLAVTDEKVGELSFNHMIGKTLDADQIDVVNLHGDNITVGTITADKLIINGLGDITANLGTVTSGKIVAGDGSDGVDVSGLDADDPDQYTPYKKSLLKAQIAVLEAQANSAIAYGEATDNDYSSIVTARDALLDGTASLLSDMTVTTEFDHTKIQTWETNLQTAISDFQSVVNNALDKKIGTTADGKNAINEGTEEPTNPNVGDLFLKQQTDGTYAIEIYTENGWTSPALQAINDVAKQVSSLPQNYYSAEQPSGTDFTDGSHWYEQTGTDSNGNPIYTTYLWNSSTNTWNKMLNSGEVDNANQISQVKSDLTQAQSDITTAQNNITTAQNDITTAQNNIKTNADAISDANGNISSLQSSASKLESDMADAQGNISTLQNSATTFESDISSLQSDNTTNKTNISSLQNTANGFSDTVATLQTQVNNSAVGTNLIVASSVINAMSMDNNGANTSFPTTFITNYIEVVVGESYTVSTTLSSSRSRIAFYGSSKSFISRLADTAISNSSPQTFTIPNGASFIKFSPDESNGKYENNFKLEKGSHATDWSANPADNATVTSVSNLSNTVDGLSNTVSNNSGNITTLQTRANGFDVSVGQLQNSATAPNLLLNTADYANNWTWDVVPAVDTSQTPNVLHYPSTTVSGSATSIIAQQTIGTILQPSTTYTASFYAKGTGSFIFYCYPNVGFVASDNRTTIDLTSNYKLYTITFTTVANISGSKNFLLRNDYNSSGGTSNTVEAYIYGLKLETGSLATNWCLSLAEQLTSTGNYAGLSINSNGLTQVAGSTSVYLSNTHGFEIQKSGSDIFHVDTSGNLTMQGNITAGNISGVNFTGNNLTLAGTLAVTGSISADNGNVVINSSGITIKGANLTIGDSSGNTTTYIQSDGTFITNKGVFTGSVTSSNVTITGGDINMNGGKFHVDSSGNVTANSFTSTGSTITDGSISQSTFKIHNSDNSFNATLGEVGSNYWGFQLYSSGNETWIDQNGIHNTDTNGTDTYIKNGVISTNIIDAQSKLHVGNSDSDPRNIWGADIDVNGLSFGVPVKKSGATTNNASDYETEIQGYINGQGWNYKTTNVNGTGYSGIAIGLATQQAWGTPYGGDFIGIGQFNPTSDIPNASSGNIGSANFDPAIAYWATGAGNAYGAYTVSIEPTLYLGSGKIKTLSGDIDLNPAGSLGLFGGYISMESTGTIHIKANGGNYIHLYSNNQMDVDGGSFWTSNGAGFWFWQGIGGTGGAVVHGKSFANVSLLSAKTNITKLDSAHALSLINKTNVYDYQYKEDVESGSSKHYASFIIDDVNEVSEYTEPDEFLSEDKKGRDDGTLLAYAVVVIKELIKQNSDLQMRVTKLEIEGNNK